MATPNKASTRFADLTWEDMEDWAGGNVLSRGKSYQRQGRVADLAISRDGGLLAWVAGSQNYATRVVMGEDGLPESECSCPYAYGCKHGVAIVLDYLKHLESDRRIPEASLDDERLALLRDRGRIHEAPGENEDGAVRRDIDHFLQAKSHSELVELIQELASRHPEVASELSDRNHLEAGQTEVLVSSLLAQIREVGSKPGWGNFWREDGFTPDYSKVRYQLDALLKSGFADEGLTVGRELIAIGHRQVEQSHDEGETLMEIAECIPFVVKALDQSSLDSVDKLAWALDALLEDEYGLCEDFAEYLNRPHAQEAWHKIADQIQHQLKEFKNSDEDGYRRDYARDNLSDWLIHALEKAGRGDEIVPLCMEEAERTDSYLRLVERLVGAGRTDEAVVWIRKGIRATEADLPGLAASLREQLRDIRISLNDWAQVAVLRVEEFVREPSRHSFGDCQTACVKVKAWTRIRPLLMRFLEKGVPPWKHKSWYFPHTGLAPPAASADESFPLYETLIEVAIFEEKPDQVLRWYDQSPERRFGGFDSDDDAVADAVSGHAPERAVAIWKAMAEVLIARVNPKAYLQAAGYLRKGAEVMRVNDRSAEWQGYLEGLRREHARKRRLIEILDGLQGRPILTRD